MMRRTSTSIPLCILAFSMMLCHAVAPRALAQQSSVQTASREGTEVLVVDGEVRYAVVEGDMLIPWEEWPQQGKSLFKPDLWLGGLIRYEFEGLSVAQESLMLQAFAIVEGIANVEFRQGMGPFDSGINIYSTNPDDCGSCDCVNNATVGASFFGSVNICNWGLSTILHELGHVLALRHEQSRPDRDTFITVHYENIIDEKEGNFDIRNEVAYGPYDLTSLMHYWQCAFLDENICTSCSDVCRSITVLPPNEHLQGSIGMFSSYSDLDRLTMSFMYPQPEWRFVDSAYGGSFPDGSFLMPYPSVQGGVTALPTGGTLWIQPGSYSNLGTFGQNAVWQAPLGGVTIGP